jgi:hypothetical protein
MFTGCRESDLELPGHSYDLTADSNLQTAAKRASKLLTAYSFFVYVHTVPHVSRPGVSVDAGLLRQASDDCLIT